MWPTGEGRLCEDTCSAYMRGCASVEKPWWMLDGILGRLHLYLRKALMPLHGLVPATSRERPVDAERGQLQHALDNRFTDVVERELPSKAVSTHSPCL